MRKTEKRIKLGGIILCEAFTVFTILSLLVSGETDRLALAFGTIAFVLLPLLLEEGFHCRIALPVYIFALAYSLGPMLGHCWKLYYTVPVWDKLLHISGGVMFTILGAFLFDRMTKDHQLPAVRILFALCFSMAIAVLWEFCEFGADTFLGMDMQDDTLVHSLTSYLLSDTVGMTGSIEAIRSVTVNGIALPGYIDIGLIDTMLDMLLETAGALITCVVLWLDKQKHPLIQYDHAAEESRVTA